MIGADFKKILDTDIYCSHQTDDSYTMNKFHFHDVFEIYLAVTSGLNFFVDNVIYPVEKNDLFIFNNSDLHRIGISQDIHYERYIIVFNPGYVSNLNTELTDLLECFTERKPDFSHRIHLSDEDVEKYLFLFEKIMKYSGSADFGTDVYLKITFTEMLIWINHLYQNNMPMIHVEHKPGYSRIKSILDHINKNLNSELSLNELSTEFFLSKFHLCKIFRSATGFTVKEYITYRRIIKATELLRKGISISEVSDIIGFANYSHFITTFKKIIGTTPKQYSLSKNGVLNNYKKC